MRRLFIKEEGGTFIRKLAKEAHMCLYRLGKISTA